MHRTGLRSAVLTAASALLLTLSASSASGSALGNDQPAEPGRLTLVDTPVGRVLADERGNPLYLRASDPPGRTTCTGSCTVTWPAAVGLATRAKGVPGVIAWTRDNAANSDKPQVLFNGRPLYYFKDDRPRRPIGHRMRGFNLVGADGRALTPSESTSGTPTAVPSDRPSNGSSVAATASRPATASPSASAAATGLPTEAAPSPGATAPDTSASTSTSTTSATAGAVFFTPSGAARGGADHTTDADTAGVSGLTRLLLATGVIALGVVGAILIVRRVQRRTTGRPH